jgi:hypothetical protein
VHILDLIGDVLFRVIELGELLVCIPDLLLGSVSGDVEDRVVIHEALQT